MAKGKNPHQWKHNGIIEFMKFYAAIHLELIAIVALQLLTSAGLIDAPMLQSGPISPESKWAN